MKKNYWFIAGTLAVLLAFSLVLTGCVTGDDPSCPRNNQCLGSYADRQHWGHQQWQIARTSHCGRGDCAVQRAPTAVTAETEPPNVSCDC